MNWSDQQRAQLLQIYKDKITQLGEEEFFNQFDQIREEAYKAVGGDPESTGPIPFYHTNLTKEEATDFYLLSQGVAREVFPSLSLKSFARCWSDLDGKEKDNEELQYTPHDNRTYATNCTDGKGVRQSHLAEGYIISPTGRRISAMCKACAQVVIDEYKQKLGEIWTFEEVEYRPIGKSVSSIPHYVDPVHTSATVLGRLGGRAKSEAKTTSSRSNGKKGGRTQTKQLDLEEI